MSASSNQVPNKSVVAFAWCSDMAKQVSLTYQRIQLVLRAKSDQFCRCEDGNCGGESCDCSRSFTIPNDCVKQVAGTYYVKLSRKNVSVRRLMCCFAHASDESNEGYLLQVLGKVSVVDDLVAERNIAVAMAACNCSRERAAKLHPRWREWKKHRASLANIPEVLEITSPQIGDVPCCQLKILASNLKSTGHPCVMMEFTDESLGWLANAIDWQFRQGGCTSRYATSKQETRTKQKQKEKKGTAQQGDHPAEEAEGAKADGTDTENSSCANDEDSHGADKESNGSGGESGAGAESPDKSEEGHDDDEVAASEEKPSPSLAGPIPPARQAVEFLSPIIQHTQMASSTSKGAASSKDEPAQKQLKLSDMFRR